MEFAGRYRIAADRETVWRALNDPSMLRQAIPGCETLEPQGETAFLASLSAGLGPVSAKVTGVIEIEEPNAPQSYRLRGKGGMSGYVAEIELAEDGPSATLVSYTARAAVRKGPLANIGGGVMKRTVGRMVGRFFTRMAKRMKVEVAELPVEAQAA